MPKRPLLICVVGPTAIGKTSLSIKIAKAFDTYIVSADSRQFYKETTIGTAVPSPDELKEVKHYFIQDRSILQDYSVGDYEKEANSLLDQLFGKKEIVVLVGGSGLYVDALVKGLDHFPKVSAKIREQLNADFQSYGIEFLQKELKEVDPDYYDKVDIFNHHRLIRALEVYRASNKAYSSFLSQEKSPRPYDTLFIGLTAEREIIYDRINRRVDLMIAQGLIEEAKSLHPFKDYNALQTVGYKELFRYFDEQISKEFAIEEIKKNTRRFSKRQMTWFKKNDQIHWFDYSLDFSEIIGFIKAKNA